jgi:hypothetical protein
MDRKAGKNGEKTMKNGQKSLEKRGKNGWKPTEIRGSWLGIGKLSVMAGFIGSGPSSLAHVFQIKLVILAEKMQFRKRLITGLKEQ